MTETLNLGDWLSLLRTELRVCTDTASLEAQLILEKVTGYERPFILCHPETKVSVQQAKRLDYMLMARLSGEPLPYLLGSWEFFGHSFLVNPSVLIPRPETELMVETALTWLRQHECRCAADIGTGSGCIAISLLLAQPQLQCCGVDISMPALSTAVQNARRHACESRFLPVCGDLTGPLAGPLSLICANLPYIPGGRCSGLEVARFEPLLALDGGEDGFDCYRRMFSDLQGKLAPEFLILCELEYSQRNLALQTAAHFFPAAHCQVKNDLAGLPRLLVISNC